MYLVQIVPGIDEGSQQPSPKKKKPHRNHFISCSVNWVCNLGKKIYKIAPEMQHSLEFVQQTNIKVDTHNSSSAVYSTNSSHNKKALCL